MTPAPHRARRRLTPGSLTFCAVLLVGTVGVLVAAAGRWREGSEAIAGALLVAGLVRLVLPDRLAGMLRVRRRVVDVAVFVLLGVAIALVALAIPDPSAVDRRETPERPQSNAGWGGVSR
ncbi:MAG: DUF3017 domain-containing protein [Actinomycetota bacterium]|nr:DUF3017 domain-containing protein [Actinomycetota bacterium]